MMEEPEVPQGLEEVQARGPWGTVLRKPGSVVVGLLLVVTTALAVVLALALVQAGDALERRDAMVDRLSANSDVLRAQVQRAGETPAAPPADVVTGREGNPGAPGVAGLPGRAGRDGRDGAPGGSGLAGQPGKDGRDGQGAPGPAGPPGTPGRDGQNGEPGEDGAPGRDGEPPASWTWTDDLGATHVCTRDEGSPQSAPTYTCHPSGGTIP